MGRHGENIRKRKDGRWEGRHAKFDQKKNKTTYHSVYGRTYSDVKCKLEIVKSENINDTSKKEISNQTFSQMSYLWLNQVKSSKKHSTYIKYRDIYNRFLKANIGDHFIEEIDIEKVTNCVMNIEKSKNVLSESRTRSIFCVINQILSYASEIQHVKLQQIKRNTNVKVMNKPTEIFNQSEQARLISYLYHEMDINKLGILLCLSTGLRLGEICAIRWDDIDLYQKIIHVKRTVQRISTENADTKTVLLETEPKSLFSKREIPISEPIGILLNNFFNGKVYLLSGTKPMEPRTYQNRFKRMLENAGITDRNFHTLRHTFATNCIDNGTDVKSLSEILGHSDVEITLNRYVHPSMETKRQHMDSLFFIYGQYCGQYK